MSILTVNNLYKNFSGEAILKNLSFAIENKDKIGLIGLNGAGKTTLIKILMEKESLDINPQTKQPGNISKQRGLKIGYLSQNINLNNEISIFEELMLVFKNISEDYKKITSLNLELSKNSKNLDSTMKELATVISRYEHNEGYAIEYKIKQVLNGLNISKNIWNQKIKNLSGGQKSRIALGKILLEEPDLLILDEPTNHLDLETIEWLEKFLKEYNKSFLIVSHDRYFLNNVVTKIFEIENKFLKIYKGNFDDFVIQKNLYLSGALKAFNKEQEKIKKTEEYIERYRAGIKSKQARGRQSLLNRMEKMDNPVFNPRKIKLKFEINRPSADKVLTIENLSKSYNGKKLFENININIYRGEKIGILGKNGVGKSTLLKIIVGKTSYNSGTVLLGENVSVGYFDQNHDNLDLNSDILSEFMFNFPMGEEDVRNLASGFLFSEENIFKKIKSLSGGEKSRISLMKLILKKANFILLDEPTNHLDIYSREILEESLENFEGTLLIVSHDRYFLENTTNVIYEITEDGANKFSGNYKDYCNSKSFKKNDKTVSKINNYQKQKKIKNQISSLEKEYKKIEKSIELLENKKNKLELSYKKAGKENNLNELINIQNELNLLENNILELIDNWEKIEDNLKTLKKAF